LLYDCLSAPVAHIRGSNKSKLGASRNKISTPELITLRLERSHFERENRLGRPSRA
jgi:hypothetical protein